jgi:general secretion pathway protein D
MVKRTFHIIRVSTLMALFMMPGFAWTNAAESDPNSPLSNSGRMNDVGGDYDMVDNINPKNVRLVLNFRDAQVGDVLDYLSEKAGLVIISDTYPTGRINLISKQPLNIDEVIALLTTVLKEQGYAAIRTGRTLKLVSLSEAPTLNIPVTTGNDPDKIPEGDEVVTHIVPVRYADALRLREDLSPLVSDYAVLASNEASNSLIITDTTSNIKRLVKIIRSLDTQMSSVADVRVFLLKYADADRTADLINQVFEQRTTSAENQNQNPFLRMMGRGPGGRGGRGGRSGDEEEQGVGLGAAQNVPVIAAADDRTNAVVVSGPADVLVVIGQVVKELDSNPDEERQLFTYKLKYAQAQNIMERLNNLFQELQNINEQNTRGAGGFGGGARGRAATTESSSGSISDEVYFEADEDTNSVIVMTSSKNWEKIKKIIEELDVPTPQVLIKVLIAELTTSEGSDIGFSWSVFDTPPARRVDGKDYYLNEFSYTPLPTEGLTSQIIQGDLTVTLRALAETGELNILSRPYIMTSNNQTATINVGQRYPFVTDSQVTDQGNTINTVDYRDIGITLEVTPSINVDGLVIMDVSPEIITALADTAKISDTFDATIFATRTAQCRVAVPNGQTVVIGGLMQDDDTTSTEKVPILGDLPLVGLLFQRTVVDNEKTELLIFLTPQVATTVEDLDKLSEHTRSQSEFLNAPEGNEHLKEQVRQMDSVYDEAEESDEENQEQKEKL